MNLTQTSCWGLNIAKIMSISITKFLSENKEELINNYLEINSIAKAVRKLCVEKDIPYTESFRAAASKIINSEDLTSVENITTTETKQYESADTFSMPSAWCKNLNKFLTIEEYCIRYGLDIKSVKSSKLVSHNASHMTYNIAFYTSEESAVEDVKDDLEEVVKKHISPVKIDYPKRVDESYDKWFDRLVYTDTHIGMDVNGKDGDSMYDGKWDKEQLLVRLDEMISHTLTFKKSNTIYIDDLGDFLDGLGGETTRKGHALPQNMNDKEVFDLGVQFKMKIIDSLVYHYDQIICNSVTNDNHSGVFAYFVNSAVKSIAEQKYPGRVQCNLFKRFIEHYKVGNHTFVISHGKDKDENRFGFKPILDSKQAEKIDQYCKEHRLYDNNFIEFSKGDSHQAIYDDTTSNDFYYYSYPAFSPPSNWVKTNFKLSRSGFRFYNIHREEDIKITIPCYFN